MELDVLFKRDNPDECQMCFGRGDHAVNGATTEGWVIMECLFCFGTGESDAPLFTREDSTDFCEWFNGRA